MAVRGHTLGLNPISCLFGPVVLWRAHGWELKGVPMPGADGEPSPAGQGQGPGCKPDSWGALAAEEQFAHSRSAAAWRADE